MGTVIDLSRQVEVERSGGEHAVPEGNLMSIVPDSIRIYAKNFLSKDGILGRRREGFVSIDIAGQSTIVPFEGDPDREYLEVDKKYLQKVIYLGICHMPIPIKIQLIESDEEARKKLDDIINITEFIGGINFPGMPPIIGAGAGLLSSIMRYAKTRIDDDDESVYFGLCRDLLHEQTISYTMHNSKAPVMKVSMKVEDFGKIDDSTTGLRISIAKPKIELTEETIRAYNKRRKALDYLIDARKLTRFNFQAKSGSLNQAFSTSFNTLGEIMSWDEFELFRFKVKSSRERSILPISYSFSLNNRELNAEELLGVVNNMVSMVNAMGGDASKAEDLLKKNGPTVVGLISELAKDALSLDNFDGIAVLLPPGGEYDDKSGHLFITPVEDGAWKRSITSKIIATVGTRKERMEIGSLSYDLLINKIEIK